MTTIEPTAVPDNRPLADPGGRRPGQGNEAFTNQKLQRKMTDSQVKLTLVESCMASFVLVAWLVLFAAGILVDTLPFRCKISPGGVAALNISGASRNDGQGVTGGTAGVCPPVLTNQGPSTIQSWAVVLFTFLPLNLAWVCTGASALGAFGWKANLSNDHPHRSSRDNRNPYVSAMLRGFFVYLFLTSGLLLLDDAPFSNPTPGQYIRLAGFLSLFSFVVSYQPRLFNKLIVWAFERIQMREGDDVNATDTLYAKKTTVELKATHTPQDGTEHSSSSQQHNGTL